VNFRTNVLKITSRHCSVSIQRVTNCDHKFATGALFSFSSWGCWGIISEVSKFTMSLRLMIEASITFAGLRVVLDMLRMTFGKLYGLGVFGD
jgi:hypothetical protein